MLCHKGLEATPIGGINPDHICGIRFNHGSSEKIMSLLTYTCHAWIWA